MQFMKDRLYVGLKVRVHKAERQVAGAECQSSCVQPQTQNRKSELDMVWAGSLAVRTSSNKAIPPKAPQCHHLVTNVQMYDPMGDSLFKLLYQLNCFCSSIFNILNNFQFFWRSTMIKENTAGCISVAKERPWERRKFTFEYKRKSGIYSKR